MHASDVELLEKARLGDAAACDDLVGRYAPRLFGLAYSMLGKDADAEDMVQETLLAALEKGDSYAGRSSLWTWLSGILVNRVGKFRRWRGVRKAASLDEPDGPPADMPTTGDATPALQIERQTDAAAMLQSLSVEHREVLVMRELQGLSYQEIADALKVPLGTVESRISRARQELRTRYVDYLS